MGFRSSFVTEDVCLKTPDWFREKYQEWVNFGENGFLPISSKTAVLWGRTYFTGEDLEIDLQKALNEYNGDDGQKIKLESIVFVWLHDCGGITRVQVYPDKIVLSEPSGWNLEDGVMHGEHCYGCSDPGSYLYERLDSPYKRGRE